jgi:RES domain-containing protein
LILWRISNYPDLTDTGGLLHAGRWHSRARPVVYLAESAAGALLEALVHIEAAHPSELPRSYQLLEVEVLEQETGKLSTTQDCQDLPEGWQDNPVVTRRIGDHWLASGDSLLLRVPSAVVGRTFNYLFNPAHPLAQMSRIISVARYPFDDRILGS